MPSIEVLSNCGENVEELRKKVLDHHTALMQQHKEQFHDLMAELYFLQKERGNMMDLFLWKKKPPAGFYDFIRSQPLELPESETKEEPTPKAITLPGRSLLILFSCYVLHICLEVDHNQMCYRQKEEEAYNNTWTWSNGNKIDSPVTGKYSMNFSEPPTTRTAVSTPSQIAPSSVTPVKTGSAPRNLSLSSSLPNLMRSSGSTGQVGRPPSTVMTQEQIVEKAKQVMIMFFITIYLFNIANSFLWIFRKRILCRE